MRRAGLLRSAHALAFHRRCPVLGLPRRYCGLLQEVRGLRNRSSRDMNKRHSFLRACIATAPSVEALELVGAHP